jgi:hypothetical protein
MPDEKEDKFNIVKIPPKFLDKLYEYCGGDNVGHGFFLCAMDADGTPFFLANTQSKTIEIGLRSYLSARIKDMETLESETVLNNMSFDEPEDSDNEE